MWIDKIKKYFLDDSKARKAAELLESQYLYFNNPHVQKAMELYTMEWVQGEIKEKTELEKEYVKKVEDIVK